MIVFYVDKVSRSGWSIIGGNADRDGIFNVEMCREG